MKLICNDLCLTSPSEWVSLRQNEQVTAGSGWRFVCRHLICPRDFKKQTNEKKSGGKSAPWDWHFTAFPTITTLNGQDSVVDTSVAFTCVLHKHILFCNAYGDAFFTELLENTFLHLHQRKSNGKIAFIANPNGIEIKSSFLLSLTWQRSKSTPVFCGFVHDLKCSAFWWEITCQLKELLPR